jgi:AcrR family transcriptional regulator
VLLQLILLMIGTAGTSEPRRVAIEWAAVVRVLVHALLVHDCPAACGLRLDGAQHPHGAEAAERSARSALTLGDVTVAPPFDELALLQAVIETLDQHGPDAVVLRELCDRVGVSASWLYRRFGDRRQLIDAARLEIARRQSLREVETFTQLIEVGENREQLVRHLTELVQGIGEASSSAPHLERIDLVASTLHEPGLLAAWIDIAAIAIDRMAMTLDELQRRGSMRDDLSAAAVGRMLWGLMTAGVVARFAGIDADAWASLTAAVVGVLVGAGSDAQPDRGAERA